MVHHLVFYLYRGVSSLFALLCHYVSFKKTVSGYCVCPSRDAKTEELLLNESLPLIPTACARPAGRERATAS